MQHGAAKSARVANAAADKLTIIYRELRERGERAHLLPLLQDADASVRSWAAAHALEFSTDAAVRVLEALAAGPLGPRRLSALMKLQEWRAGRLTFP